MLKSFLLTAGAAALGVTIVAVSGGMILTKLSDIGNRIDAAL